MEKSVVGKMLDYLDASPSCFHATENLKQMLLNDGYQLLRESEVWQLQRGGKYVVIRNDSSLIAFRIPTELTGGFVMAAAHSDSPTFKLRETSEVESGGSLVLTTEPYGGAIRAAWMDRPLSVAGRVMTEEDGCLRTRLVNIDRDLLVIPNVAPHLNRTINDGVALKPNVDLRPVIGTADDKGKFRALVAEAAGVKEENILSSELFLYPRMRGTLIGAEEQYVLSPRLDDLQCAFTCTEGFIRAKEGGSVPVLCVFNNEEVGSGTLQGADSNYLGNVLKRISRALGRTEEEHMAALAGSFMVSADNAHAVHPNHTEYADANEKVSINGGVVVKFNANQKYATDAVSAAIFRRICRMVDAPVQTYSNRADMPGGGTLGNISITRVSVPTVDVGLPQWAMHSACEVAGAVDTENMVRIMEFYFSRTLRLDQTGAIQL